MTARYLETYQPSFKILAQLSGGDPRQLRHRLFGLIESRGGDPCSLAEDERRLCWRRGDGMDATRESAGVEFGAVASFAKAARTASASSIGGAGRTARRPAGEAGWIGDRLDHLLDLGVARRVSLSARRRPRWWAGHRERAVTQLALTTWWFW